MTIEQQVADLTNKVAAVLSALNVSKSYIDAAAKAAIAGVTAQGAISPTPGKSPIGNVAGVFDPAWIDQSYPLKIGHITATYNTPEEVATLLRLNSISGAAGNHVVAVQMGYPGTLSGTRMVSGGDPTREYGGYTAFENGSPNGYIEIGRFVSSGALLLGSKVSSGAEALQVTGTASFASAGTQGAYLMKAGLVGSQPSFIIYSGNGTPFGQPASVMYVGKNSNTDRGISSNGTINTMGNDYAEYILKCPLCGSIAKGQIVGLTQDNLITDQWSDAVMFAIKSTEPSFVGGDTWAKSIGSRPTPLAGAAPKEPPRLGPRMALKPVSNSDPVMHVEYEIPGDTDAEWAQKLAAHTAELVLYDAAKKADDEAIAAYDAALEAQRLKVDRIAIAGRVPVNVQGAQPGDYIVPAQDAAGIKGIVIAEADITLAQYLKAVGKVINILPDGRAYVMVKSA